MTMKYNYNKLHFSLNIILVLIVLLVYTFFFVNEELLVSLSTTVVVSFMSVLSIVISYLLYIRWICLNSIIKMILKYLNLTLRLGFLNKLYLFLILLLGNLIYIILNKFIKLDYYKFIIS